MAVLELSAGFVSGGYLSRLFTLGTFFGAPASSATSRASVNGLLTSTGTSNYGNTCNTYFYIMKGIIPADFSTLTNFNARSSDVLMTYVTKDQNAGDFLPTSLVANPSVITTIYVPATTTGTATWFWWTQRMTLGGAVNGTDPFVHQIIGIVGAVGSNSDLEISDTNIISGNSYRIYNLRLNWPTIWTF